MNFSETSGLEIMQSLIAGKLPRPAMIETIPMIFVDAQPGYIKSMARADARHINIMGGVHGGFAATVLDTITGCAIHTMLEAGVIYATVDLNIKMVKPIPVNMDVAVEAKVLHVSKTIGVSEGSIKSMEGVLLAHATTTCVIKRKSTV